MINTTIDRPKASLRSRFLLHIIVFILFFVPPSLSQAWDGVVITQADYQGLQAVKQELIDPRGFLRSWNGSGFSACSGGWSGIKCAQGQVIVIQLPWKSLGGRISEKTGQLQALRKLSLHDNNLGDSIPMSLGLIPNLRGFQLFNNRLTGSIPASLGVSRFLQTLDPDEEHVKDSQVVSTDKREAISDEEAKESSVISGTSEEYLK